MGPRQVTQSAISEPEHAPGAQVQPPESTAEGRSLPMRSGPLQAPQGPLPKGRPWSLTVQAAFGHTSMPWSCGDTGCL